MLRQLLEQHFFLYGTTESETIVCVVVEHGQRRIVFVLPVDVSSLSSLRSHRSSFQLSCLCCHHFFIACVHVSVPFSFVVGEACEAALCIFVDKVWDPLLCVS